MAQVRPWHPSYDVHPSIAMTQNVIAALKTRTGRSIDEWVRFVKKEGPPTEAQRRAWLKDQHALGTNYAWWIAERAEGKGGDEDSPQAYLAMAPKYVDGMYAGKRAALRPIHDALIKLGRQIADDVMICPCKTIVPFFRRHVIAQIKPATNTRIDFGYALGDTKPGGRLMDTGGFAKKDRITHRIAIGSLEDIDDEVRRWLEVAYERDAPSGKPVRLKPPTPVAAPRKSKPRSSLQR